jgi:diguanylate cyclase (GGDEF)-like protein
MQADKTAKLSPDLARLVGIFLFLGLGVGTEAFLFEQRQSQAAARKAQAAAHSEKIRARLEGELNAALALSNGLAGYWAVRRDFPGPNEARGILADHYRRSRHVRSFAVTDGYRVAQVFPQDDQGQALGLDYRSLARQWPSIQHSVETRSPMLEGPSPPALAMTYRVPIFVDGQFRGFLSTLIDGFSLLAASGFAHEDYHYALRARGEPGPARQAAILGADALFADPAAAVTNISAPGENWRLAVKPKALPGGEDGQLPARALGWLFAGLFALQSAALLRLNRKLAGLALYDRLTGLPSRHLFLDRLKQTIRRAKRNRGNFSVLFVNLSEFKAINHARGEKVGDMMLAGIGKRLIGSIRHCDTVTRWGGDEFVILLDACPQDQAKPIAENLRHKIELPVSYGEAELRIGAAIGVATFPEDGHSLAALLKVAEARMRKDKGGRRKGQTLAESAAPGAEESADAAPARKHS